MSYRLLDDALEEEIVAADRPGKYLILEEDSAVHGHWVVQSLRHGFRFDLQDIIGSHSLVSPANLEEFLDAAEEGGYHVVFGENPYTILDAYESLNATPDITLDSEFPDTVNGFLKFQVQGFNKVKDLDGSVAQWATGCGKSVVAAGLTKYHEYLDHFDIGLHVVKAHNKVNTARGLLKLAGIESVILDGTLEKREKVYLELLDRLELGLKTVVILNYEKFRDDFCWFEKKTGKNGDYQVVQLHDWAREIFTKRLWISWDEMPTKLKNRESQLYLGVVKCLYRTNAPSVNWDRKRPAELRQIMTSATPIENNPEDFFNAVRILDPRIYGTVTDFRNDFVAYYDHFDRDKPKGWHNLDVMALRAAHIVHQVDKTHPEIAAQFPDVVPIQRVIDWDPRDRKIYDKLTKELVRQVEDDEEGMGIFAALAVMQMLCNAPAIVNDSAALREAYEEALEAWEDDGAERPQVQGSKGAMALLEALDGQKLTNAHHTKIAQLKEDLTVNYPDEKIVLFTSLNRSIMPTIEGWLQDWGVSYVRYDGTTKQKQDAEDGFREDPSIRVFLSSDKGSDSINLEMAAIVINYDGPVKWTTETQRNNRVHRLTSTFQTVRFISYEMDDSIDTRKRKIREKKKAYHDAVFGGVIKSGAISASATRNDLLWVLGG